MKKKVKPRVPRTRNANTMTESMYWSKVRSVLRNGFRYWKPISECLKDSRRGKSRNYEYQCNHCNNWFKRKEVEVDHIIPVGTLKCPEDLAGFLERLTPEDGFQVLCSECHQAKTNKERK